MSNIYSGHSYGIVVNNTVIPQAGQAGPLPPSPPQILTDTASNISVIPIVTVIENVLTISANLENSAIVLETNSAIGGGSEVLSTATTNNFQLNLVATVAGIVLPIPLLTIQGNSENNAAVLNISTNASCPNGLSSEMTAGYFNIINPAIPTLPIIEITSEMTLNPGEVSFGPFDVSINVPLIGNFTVSVGGDLHHQVIDTDNITANAIRINLSITAPIIDPISTNLIINEVNSGIQCAICVAKDTKILMADRTEKAIQDIKRGDMVASDPEIKNTFKVARLHENRLPSTTPLGLVTFGPNTVAEKQPHSKLIITSGHPVLYNGSRYRSKSFRKLPDVRYYSKSRTIASKILPMNDDNETCSLYNLQFEHDGYYVANGLPVESIPVQSSLSPLPKNLFFNQEYFNKPSYVKVAPLVKDLLI